MKKFYYNLDCIHTALCDDRQISFCYYRYSYDRKKILRHNGKRCAISHWTIINDDAKMKCFHIDMMCDLFMLENKREGKDYYSLPKMKSHVKLYFGMFYGDRKLMTFDFKEDMIDVLIERLGLDIHFQKTEDEICPYETKIMLCVSPVFYG